MAKQYFLVIDGQKTQKLRRGKTYLIGRSKKQANIAIKDESISRQHAKLIVGTSSITIQDIGSVNGTKVDDKELKINQLVMLRKGMIVQLGECTNELSIDFDEVDSDQSVSRSRSKEKQIVHEKKNEEQKKQKIWNVSNLKANEKEKLKRLMGAKDMSDDEEQGAEEIEKINKNLECQYKVALNHKTKGFAGLGF